MRHGRHHAPLRQAQLSREGRPRPRGNGQEGVLHRPHRPSRPRADRHPEGRLQDALRIRAGQERRTALLQPGHQGPFGPDPQGRVAAADGQAPVHLHGRRHHPGRCLARAEPVRRPARLPGHQHADGPGRLPRLGSQVPRHARHARHLRSEHGDAALRRADRDRRAFRRPRDRRPGPLRLASAQDHSHRHRSVLDQQARQGRHPDRRRRQGSAQGN